MGAATALALGAAWTVAPGAEAASEGKISEFALPSTESEPLSITHGPEGDIWFTEYRGERLGRITTGGEVSELPLPSTSAHPEGIAVGPEGDIWFAERSADKIGRMTPTGETVEFQIPAAEAEPEGIATGPEGNLWFTETKGDAIARITPGGAVSEYKLPTPGSRPKRIVLGPDGNLWFTESQANRIGRVTPAGAITEIQLPSVTGGPWGIAAGPGETIWFTDFQAGKIGRITTAGEVKEYALSTDRSFPGNIAPGPDGDMWFTERNGDKIGRITPEGKISEFSLPRLSDPAGITAGPDGKMWFAEAETGKIGEISTGAAAALIEAPTIAGGASAGMPQTCDVSWSTWDSLQPSNALYGFDGYYWLLQGERVAAGQTFTPSTAEIGEPLACSETVTYPLLGVSASGTSAPMTVTPAPPQLTKVRETTRSWHVGAAPPRIEGASKAPLGSTFYFSLNERASVTFSFSMQLTGRKVGAKCVSLRPGSRVHANCSRSVGAGKLTFSGRAGSNSVGFQGRVSRGAKPMRPGHYTLSIVASAAGHARSAPAKLTFAIVK